MGFIDWLIVAVLLLLTLNGLRKGLAATLVHIGGGVALFLLWGQIFPLVKNALIVNLKLGLIPATILAVILIVLATAVALALLERLFHKVLKGTHLSGLNRFLGLLFGLLNGLLVVILLMVLLDLAPKLSTPLKDGAKHPVYAAVDVFKEDVFRVLKFGERDRFQQIKERISKDEDKSQAAE
ncbi:MAG: CvpA family protein [Candidatus Cloacimonadaceae bacterium]